MANKKDLTGGDHSFKKWFKIMFGNFYITLGVIALAAVSYELWNLGEIIQFIKDSDTLGGIMATILALIPMGMLSIVSFKGFYQKWDDLKKGKSR